jgi:hypothetical protein
MTNTIVRSIVAEQCDRCIARAKVRAIFLAGDLFFCLHHATESGVAEKASEIEFIIQD